MTIQFLAFVFDSLFSSQNKTLKSYTGGWEVRRVAGFSFFSQLHDLLLAPKIFIFELFQASEISFSQAWNENFSVDWYTTQPSKWNATATKRSCHRMAFLRGCRHRPRSWDFASMLAQTSGCVSCELHSEDIQLVVMDLRSLILCRFCFLTVDISKPMTYENII